ncbi:MAG TPA: polyhydroxyalkanoate synthesis repressor PhaR, partial [Thermomonas sp.]|nr:polyhydroxyalkanoate synthesis repressor PhaR [Thermomonas sp.]
GLMGQTPWTLLNQLTERNMELWKDFQNNLVGGMGSPTAQQRGREGQKPR